MEALGGFTGHVEWLESVGALIKTQREAGGVDGLDQYGLMLCRKVAPAMTSPAAANVDIGDTFSHTWRASTSLTAQDIVNQQHQTPHSTNKYQSRDSVNARHG